MGCGVTHEAIVRADDEGKSALFQRLVSQERHVLAVKLHQYFRDLLSECQYHSQGNMAGYRRMHAERKQRVEVNRSVKQARSQGIGHRPLTLDGVQDVMELFLGHAMRLLVQHEWMGAFEYAMDSAAASDAVVGVAGMGDAASPLAAATGAPATDGTPMEVSSGSLRPTVTYDDGLHVKTLEDRANEVHLALSGTIRYPATDKHQSLECTSQVLFVLYVCPMERTTRG